MPIDKLIQGFRQFRSSYFEESKHYEELVRSGQSPETFIIACCDSRNDPAMLTQSRPGEIFVMRNVGAIVPPYEPDGKYHGTCAAIEFAVKGLQVKNIVVIGHALCGGIQALMDLEERQREGFEYLSKWISIGSKAKEMIDRVLIDAPRATKLRALEQAVILSSLDNLAAFPWIKERIEDGRLHLHGWYFDLVQGQLLGYDSASGQFIEIIDEISTYLHSHPHGDDCCDGGSLETLVKKYV